MDPAYNLEARDTGSLGKGGEERELGATLHDEKDRFRVAKLAKASAGELLQVLGQRMKGCC